MTNKEVAKATGVSVDTVKREKRKKRANAPKLRPEREQESPDSQIVDETGFPVPAGDAQFYWLRRPEAEAVLSKMRLAKRAVKELLPDDPMWHGVNLNGVLGDLGSAINRFSRQSRSMSACIATGRNLMRARRAGARG